MSLDTIAAISTPRGKGGVALTRISGPDAVAVGDGVFRPRSRKKLSEHAERSAVFGDIVKANAEGGESVVDSGIAVLFRAPRSFTGEDTVEISCHGGVLVSAAVLGAALSAGARQAEAGEFTRRAYAGGKLTLDEAEALGMLLDARTDAQLSLARGGMRGRLAAAADELAARVGTALGDIYARIDFPDEDLGEYTADELAAALRGMISDIKKLGATYSTGRAIAEGIPTVICGRTNAGKSTLYNRLTGEASAIVTSEEGTTRDVLTETVSFGGVTLRLSDTAGIRRGRDEAERVGIERAMERISSAELVIFVIDGSRDPNDDERDLAELLGSRSFGKVIAVLNKADLTGGSRGANKEALRMWEGFEARIVLSAESGEGIEELARLVKNSFIDASVCTETDAVVQNERQHASLVDAERSLAEALAALEDGYSADIAGLSLESALASLRSLSGRGVCAEIVDSIFSKFCVGK